MTSRGTVQISSSRSDLFTVATCDAFATESHQQARPTSWHQRVPRCLRQRDVARQQADDDRVDPTRVDLVALQDENRMPIPWLGATRLGEVHPPDLSTPDHRGLRVLARMTARVRLRNAIAAGSSPGWPACLMARFRAAVASSRDADAGPGCSRGAKEPAPLTAWRRGRLWTSRNRSSGMEIARLHALSITGHTYPPATRSPRWRSPRARPSAGCPGRWATRTRRCQEHCYRFIPNLTRRDGSALDKAAAQLRLWTRS